MSTLRWWNGRGWRQVRSDERSLVQDRVENAYVCARSRSQALRLIKLLPYTTWLTDWELKTYWSPCKGNHGHPDRECVLIERDYGGDLFAAVELCPNCGDPVVLTDPQRTDWYGVLQYADCQCGAKLVLQRTGKDWGELEERAPT